MRAIRMNFIPKHLRSRLYYKYTVLPSVFTSHSQCMSRKRTCTWKRVAIFTNRRYIWFILSKINLKQHILSRRLIINQLKSTNRRIILWKIPFCITMEMGLNANQFKLIQTLMATMPTNQIGKDRWFSIRRWREDCNKNYQLV